MRWNLWRILLAVLVFVVFTFRLWLAFHPSSFSYDAYFHLRQIEAITETGKPLFYDPLSYQGRIYMFAPLFYYVVAFFAKNGTVELAARILPNLFFALIPILVYLISYRLTRKEWAGFITAFFAAFLPQSYAHLTDASPLSLAIPFGLLMTYFSLDLHRRTPVYAVALFAILLTLTHASAFLFVLGYLFYLFLLPLLSYPKDPKESEFVLFLFLLVLWFNLLIYKKVLLTQGVFFIWQNIPGLIRAETFGQATILNTLYAVNFIPLLFGIYSIYHALLVRGQRLLFLFVGLVFGVFFLLLFGWTRMSTGLLFLGYFVAILSSRALVLFVDYMRNTRFPKLSYVFLSTILLLFLFTTFLPLLITAQSHLHDSPTAQQIEAFAWVKQHAIPNATVLATIKEGQALAYYTQRRNVVDTHFLLIPNIDQRYEDLFTIYTTRFQSEALQKLTRYGVDYIYFSPESQKIYPTPALLFIDQTCFRTLYNQTIQIHAVLCRRES